MKKLFPQAVLIFLVIASIFIGCKKESSQTTSSGSPIVTTTVPDNVTAASFTSGGTVTSDGGSSVTERGIIWISNDDTSEHIVRSGSGTGTFAATVSSLSSNNSYYVWAYAKNASGTGYGEKQLVRTEEGVPSLKTEPVTSSNGFWKTQGHIVNDGGATVTNRGVCWATHPNPTIADQKSDGFFVSTNFFDGYLYMNTNSTYYIRSFATNSYGTGYSNEVTYITGIAVGLYTGGGVIFKLDASGQHGLIAALTNQSEGAIWASGVFITGATSATDGATNTTRILALTGSTLTAAKLCRNYTGGGYNDWFLPAANQMYVMNQVGVIPGFPGDLGTSGQVSYWTSTEQTNGDANFYTYYTNVILQSFGPKWTMYKVRAIRAF